MVKKRLKVSMSDIIANIGADVVKALLDALKDNRIVATFQKLEKENPINKGHVMIVATITMESMGEVFNPNGQKADGSKAEQ